MARLRTLASCASSSMSLCPCFPIALRTAVRVQRSSTARAAILARASGVRGSSEDSPRLRAVWNRTMGSGSSASLSTAPSSSGSWAILCSASRADCSRRRGSRSFRPRVSSSAAQRPQHVERPERVQPGQCTGPVGGQRGKERNGREVLPLDEQSLGGLALPGVRIGQCGHKLGRRCAVQPGAAVRRFSGRIGKQFVEPPAIPAAGQVEVLLDGFGNGQGCSMVSRYMSRIRSVPLGVLAKLTGRNQLSVDARNSTP